MQPEDINALVWVADAALDPDGRRVAYAVSRVDGDANRYRSRIWIRAVDGTGTAAPVTSGEWDDRLPTWSPDGSLLAFVTTRRKDLCRSPSCPMTLRFQNWAKLPCRSFVSGQL